MEGERIAKAMTIYHEKYRAIVVKADTSGSMGNELTAPKDSEGEERKKSVELVKKVRFSFTYVSVNCWLHFKIIFLNYSCDA